MKTRCGLVTVVFATLLCPLTGEAQDKDIVGRVENARIYPGDLLLRAKLDSGAKHCSLNAPQLTKFLKNGERWVRFKVTNHRGEETTIERKIVRQAKIKQQGQPLVQRPVIMLGICVGRQAPACVGAPMP
ncbi:MAG: ATP-dependent zinc protease [Chitinivibrionia bacterium]|nr:ATP-dependent zinc protease [Chitinivibrionia bacterium]